MCLHLQICVSISISIYIYIHTYSLQNPLLFWLPVPCLKCIYNAFTDFVPNDRSTFGSPWHCGFCGACAPWNFQTHAPPFVPYACNCSDVRRWACSASCILSSWRVIQVASTSWAVPQSLKVPLAANATMPLWSAFVLRISQRFVPARMSQSHSGFTVRIFPRLRRHQNAWRKVGKLISYIWVALVALATCAYVLLIVGIGSSYACLVFWI